MTGNEPIQLVPPNSGWPAQFELERAALEEAIGEWACGGIHHVGSTSVPNLEAKPIIDILVGVSDRETARACFGSLAELHYLYAPYLPEVMHWFCKPDPARRTHHLHLVPVGSQRYRDELDFRDRLRADAQVASRYAALKRELAEERGSIPNESPNLLAVVLILGEQPGFPTEPLQPADQVFLSSHSAMMTRFSAPYRDRRARRSAQPIVAFALAQGLRDWSALGSGDSLIHLCNFARA